MDAGKVGGPPPGSWSMVGDSSVNPGGIQTSQMAGYIDALFALCSDDNPNAPYPIFPGLLLNSGKQSSDPEVMMALRMLMELIGNPDFSTALQKEDQAQISLPASQQCALFCGDGSHKGLYEFLSNTDPALKYKGQLFSLMTLSQRYYSLLHSQGPGSEDVKGIEAVMGAAFDNKDPNNLHNLITNIGDNNAGYSGDMVKPYQPQGTDMENALIADLQNISGSSDLSSVKDILGLGDKFNEPNDPNYLLTMALLNASSFNSNANGEVLDGSGNPIKDTSGKILTCYSLADFANLDMSQFSSADQQTISSFIQTGFQQKLDYTEGSQGIGPNTWADILSKNLPNYFSKW